MAEAVCSHGPRPQAAVYLNVDEAKMAVVPGHDEIVLTRRALPAMSHWKIYWGTRERAFKSAVRQISCTGYKNRQSS